MTSRRDHHAGWWTVGMGVAIAVSALLARAPLEQGPRVLAQPQPDVSIEAGAFPPQRLEEDYLRVWTRHYVQGAVPGQETVIFSPGAEGAAHVIASDGWLKRVDVGTNATTRIMHVGGRVLGATFAPDDPSTIIACDVAKGLIRIDVPRRRLEVLATMADDDEQRVAYCDDVAVEPASAGGRIYFSDAMELSPAPVWRPGGSIYYNTLELSIYDFLRGGRGGGRLLMHDPATGTTITLLRHLYFANGVALDPAGAFVLVAETFNMRLVRYWLRGERAGTSDVFAMLDGCVPDGVSTAPDGSGYWVACFTTPSWLTTMASQNPWLRTVVAALPTSWWPRSKRTGLVLRLDTRGDIVDSLHDVHGTTIHSISAVTEHDGQLYLGQLTGNTVPLVPVPPRWRRA